MKVETAFQRTEFCTCTANGFFIVSLPTAQFIFQSDYTINVVPMLEITAKEFVFFYDTDKENFKNLTKQIAQLPERKLGDFFYWAADHNTLIGSSVYRDCLPILLDTQRRATEVARLLFDGHVALFTSYPSYASGAATMN